MEKQSIKGKRRGRRLVLQALYQWLMSGAVLTDIEAQFRVANDMSRVDDTYFCRLLHGIPTQLNSLEQAFSPFLDRPINSLNPIELTVLRISTYELLNCPEIPYKVVLDEAISMAKEFGSQDGHRYVNGVLNNVAQKARMVEINLSKE
ncbi:MAG: transcription antitermination factor NusB [Legionella sp.]